LPPCDLFNIIHSFLCFVHNSFPRKLNHSLTCHHVSLPQEDEMPVSRSRRLNRPKWSRLRDPEFELFLDASHSVLYVHIGDPSFAIGILLFHPFTTNTVAFYRYIFLRSNVRSFFIHYFKSTACLLRRITFHYYLFIKKSF